MKTTTKVLPLALFSSLLFAACVTNDSDTVQTLESDAEAATEEVTEELDPNDPNVLVCPVTGQMQRIDAAAAEGDHGGMDEDF